MSDDAFLQNAWLVVFDTTPWAGTAEHQILQCQPIATASALASATRLTPATINKALAHLEKLGIVGRLNARRRGRVFSYRSYVQQLQAELEPMARVYGSPATTGSRAACDRL